ncbi:adenylylsulfate kinase [Candidatus Blochmanniella vafra str. BVAF]|uniref:Adenylyl-sulfate kinase n=1 Tax=Blochmanniella vafra (strain BVAF) TaxID=859654 RepID=E8Q5S5_BLOVB|nr:adenylyl-sulfate kinase [Candidatus Blochmannia vafer]ADV33572.1 adenylylsulfate kinase [Candidatus Blochmannia vafer str. BVAF]
MMIKNNNGFRGRNISWSSYCINRKNREKLHKHRAIVLWFTGLSGSGKTTLASFLEERLYHEGISTYVLDGDNIRYGLCSNLSFSHQDRYENIRRAGEVAWLMFDAGLVVLVAFISPCSSDRKMVRNMFFKNCFLEIYIDTPIEVCKSRDSKNLYKQVQEGKIKNFTGIDSPYESPENPDIYLDGTKTIQELINQLFDAVILKIFV